MSGASVDRPRIVVLNDWEQALRRLGDWNAIDARADVEVLHEPLQGEALVTAIEDADALVLVRDRTPVDEALLERLPRLRYLVFTGTRNTTLDLEALHRRGVAVSHTEWGPSKDSTCEMTWTLILAAVKQLELYTRSLREGRWRAGKPAPLPGVLAGRRLGLVGLGEIGSRVAQIGKAFGMDVVTWSPRMTEERAAEKGVGFMPLDELLSTSDVVSLHLVPTAETRHLLDARHLALMQPHSVLVNTSRAALVDMDALRHALETGRPGMAAIDVFDAEPLALDEPLRQQPRALLTPHMGFVCEPVFERFARGVVECLEAWLGGLPLVRQVLAEKAC